MGRYVVRICLVFIFVFVIRVLCIVFRRRFVEMWMSVCRVVVSRFV